MRAEFTMGMPKMLGDTPKTAWMGISAGRAFCNHEYPEAHDSNQLPIILLCHGVDLRLGMMGKQNHTFVESYPANPHIRLPDANLSRGIEREKFEQGTRKASLALHPRSSFPK